MKVGEMKVRDIRYNAFGLLTIRAMDYKAKYNTMMAFAHENEGNTIQAIWQYVIYFKLCVELQFFTVL